MCAADSQNSFAIPLSSTAIEALDMALSRLHELTNKVLLHGDDGADGEMYSPLATATLEKKIGTFYPVGFDGIEDDSDRFIWPAIIELEGIGKLATSDTVYDLVAAWMKNEGILEDDFLDDMPELRNAPDPLRTEMICAKVLGSMCEYVEGWTDALTEE